MALFDDCFKLPDQVFEFVDTQLGFFSSLAHLVGDPGEASVVNPQNHVAEHRDEPAV